MDYSTFITAIIIYIIVVFVFITVFSGILSMLDLYTQEIQECKKQETNEDVMDIKSMSILDIKNYLYERFELEKKITNDNIKRSIDYQIIIDSIKSQISSKFDSKESGNSKEVQNSSFDDHIIKEN